MSTGWSAVEQEVAEELKEQRRKERALQCEIIVKKLAAQSAPIEAESSCCVLCEAATTSWENPLLHYAGCPWRMARELLGEPVDH